MLIKNGSTSPIVFLLIDSADHITGKTGATPVVTLSKAGGAFAAAAGTVAEISSGWYKLTPTSADTNTNGFLALRATASGADPTDVAFRVIAVDPDDAAAFGLSRVDAAISTRSTYSGGDTAGVTTLLSRIASAITITSGKVDVNDKTGFSLAAAGIQAIWDALTTALTTAGSIGKRLADNIDATVSSRSTYAGADTTGTTTLLGRLTAGRATNLDNLDAAVSTRSTYAGADTAGTTTLLTRIASALTITSGKVDVNDKSGFSLSTACIQAIWDALTSALTTVGSIGKRLADNIDATISSRSTYAGGDTAGVTTLLSRLTSGRATNLDNLDAAVSTRSTYAGADTPGTTTLLSRIASAITITAGKVDVNDKTGFGLSASAVQAIWDALTSALTTANSIGKRISDFLDVAVSTRGTSTYAGGDTAGTTTLLTRLTSGRAANLDNLDAAVSTRSTYAGADTPGTTTLLARIAAAITITGGKIDVNDKSGFSLSSGGLQAIWDVLTSGLTAAGSVGKRIADFLDVAVSSRGTSTYAGGDTPGTTTLLGRVTGVVPVAADYSSARAAKLDNLDAAVSSRSTYAGGDTPGTTTLLGRIASAITITAGKVDINDKTGFSLAASGIQAVWDALTSALTTPGSVGKRIADNVDALISSRGTSNYSGADTAGTSTLLSRVAGPVPLAADYSSTRAAKLDNLDAAISSRGTGTALTASQVENAVLNADLGAHTVAGSVGAQLAIVRRLLQNRTETNPVTGVMTVYADDGITPLLTANVYEGVTTAQPYRGQGAERREMLS